MTDDLRTVGWATRLSLRVRVLVLVLLTVAAAMVIAGLASAAALRGYLLDLVDDARLRTTSDLRRLLRVLEPRPG